MDIALFEELGKIAGLAGVSIGAVIVIFRQIIAKKIFPNLTRQQAFSLLKLIVILVWSIGVLGIGSWTYLRVTKDPDQNSNSNNYVFNESIDSYETAKKFLDFISQNEGKTVYINIKIDEKYVAHTDCHLGLWYLEPIDNTDAPSLFNSQASDICIQNSDGDFFYEVFDSSNSFNFPFYLSEERGTYRFEGFFSVSGNDNGFPNFGVNHIGLIPMSREFGHQVLHTEN